MAFFSNYATLSYDGWTTRSNTVTGEIRESVVAAKTAVIDQYSANCDVTYVISLTNSAQTPMQGLTVTDDLGGYEFRGRTLYPLTYVEDSVRYFVNGVLQPSPRVADRQPLTFTGIQVPADGNAVLVYETAVTEYAPLAPESTLVNTAAVTGPCIGTPLSAQATIQVDEEIELSIHKAVSPTVVEPGGRVMYSFVIENNGNSAAEAADNVILADRFDPVLSDMSVRMNGVPWAAGTNYSYDRRNGQFRTLPGQITVPAARYAQSQNGSWIVTPGETELTITGNIGSPAPREEKD